MGPFPCLSILRSEDDFEGVDCTPLDWLGKSSSLNQPEDSIVSDVEFNAESYRHLLLLDAASNTTAFAVDGDCGV